MHRNSTWISNNLPEINNHFLSIFASPGGENRVANFAVEETLCVYAMQSANEV